MSFWSLWLLASASMLTHSHVQIHRHDDLQVLQRWIHKLCQEAQFCASSNTQNRNGTSCICIIFMKHYFTRNQWKILLFLYVKDKFKKIQSSNIFEYAYFWHKSWQEMSALCLFRAGQKHPASNFKVLIISGRVHRRWKQHNNLPLGIRDSTTALVMDVMGTSRDAKVGISSLSRVRQ